MLLKIGSNNEDVKKIQEKLGLKADGIFGSGTQQAVKTWQAANNLTADSIVGTATWNKMFADATPVATTIVSVDDLKLEVLSNHIPNVVIQEITACVTEFNINTPLRLAHFLAQCAQESNKFTTTEENLNYSADGLRKVFPKYFPGNLADSYAKQPEKIASRIYGDRMGNGDEASEEGYKYRGRGYIQLTGKDNYRAFSNAVGDDILNNPDLVLDKYTLLSAAWFWNTRSLDNLADKGSSDSVVTDITKIVNGGIIGLDDRIKYFKEYYTLLA